MKIAYGLKQKTKIAMLLFCIMACTIMIRMLEDRNTKKLNTSFSSLYSDRLLPAMHLFHITEHLHTKRHLLENALYEGSPAVPTSLLKQEIGNQNKAIDSLIARYEKTYLVKLEKEQLKTLKQTLASNRTVEERVVSIAQARDLTSGKVIFEELGKSSYQTAVENIADLMHTQNQVGEELIKDSEFIISGSKMYSSLQIALAIIIGILIVGIVFASKAAMTNTEKFHLN